MKLHAVIHTTRRSMIALVILTVIGRAANHPISAQTDVRPQVQLFTGTLDQGQTIRYLIPNRIAGEVLYIYAGGVSGNLDPFLGISRGDVALTDIDQAIESAVDAALARGTDQVVASSEDDGAGIICRCCPEAQRHKRLQNIAC